MAKRLIIIEDDETWKFIYRQQLRDVNDIVIAAEFESAEEALLQLSQVNPDIAIVDVTLPGISGLEFAEKMREYPTMKIIFVTSHQEEYLSNHNTHGCLVLAKGDKKGLLSALDS
jgi:two-component SAPR family response regulator